MDFSFVALVDFGTWTEKQNCRIVYARNKDGQKETLLGMDQMGEKIGAATSHAFSFLFTRIITINSLKYQVVHIPFESIQLLNDLNDNTERERKRTIA